MASTNKTQNLKLPQWQLTDKPEMQDFNEAFENIDTELSNKANYEEGKWTPRIYGVTTEGSPIYETGGQSGSYLKVGSLVSIRGHVWVRGKGGMEGALCISGVPDGIKPSVSGLLNASYHNANLSSGYIVAAPAITTDGNIHLRKANNRSSVLDLLDTEVTNTIEVSFSGVYISAQ